MLPAPRSTISDCRGCAPSRCLTISPRLTSLPPFHHHGLWHQPMADNSSEVGRAANRRLEIAIMANEKLKKAAQANAG